MLNHRMLSASSGYGKFPASSFLPSGLANLSLWLKADSLSLTNNDPVGTWYDSSGNSNDATQTGTARPTYKTNVLNGKPVVYMDDTDDGMVTPLVRNDGSAWSIFVVYNMPVTASGGHRVIQGSNNFLIGPYDNFHKIYNGSFSLGTALSSAWVYVTATMVAGGGLTYRIDGALQATLNNTGGPGTIYLGNSGAFSEPAACNIAELLVYTDTKNSTDITKVENYIKNKYAL
jgi:hypothetical protein